MDFINDRDKMIDFFNMERAAFLESYSYVTEDDYTETARKIGNLIQFNDSRWYDYEHCEGIELGKIIYADMMHKYCLCKCYE